jgi:hypothetical protein
MPALFVYVSRRSFAEMVRVVLCLWHRMFDRALVVHPWTMQRVLTVCVRHRPFAFKNPITVHPTNEHVAWRPQRPW